MLEIQTGSQAGAALTGVCYVVTACGGQCEGVDDVPTPLTVLLRFNGSTRALSLDFGLNLIFSQVCFCNSAG